MMNGPIDGETDGECRCGCHYAQEDAIMHCMACCYQCPKCYKNISTLSYDEHKEKCQGTRALETELQFFNENRQEWFEHHAGKIALIKGTTLYGFYDDFENSYRVGVDVWGDVDFLIKEV